MSTTESTASIARRYRVGILTAATGAAIGIVYGYDTGSISGALPIITDRFHLDATAAGWVNTLVVLGQIVGALSAGRISNLLGRKRAMMVVAAAYTVFTVLQAVAAGILMLDVVRFFLGITIGVSIVAAPLFVAESSPARFRGRFVALYQVATVAGITITYFVNYGLSFGEHWRLMLGLSAVPAALVLFPLARLPESPRWLVLSGRHAEADRVMRGVDPDSDSVAELERIVADAKRSEGGRLRDMLRFPYSRATTFVIVLGFFVQISGINAITYYSPTIFKTMGFTGTGQSLLLPSMVELAALVATVLALFVVDRMGRKPTLYIGIGTMLAGALAMTLLFATGGIDGAGAWIGFVAILLFTSAFNFGFGSMVWVYASEAFPIHLRGAGASTMLTADLVANAIVAQAFLPVLNGLGAAVTFGIFTGIAALAVGFVAVFAPETKGKRLETIREYWERGGHWPEPEQDERAATARTEG